MVCSLLSKCVGGTDEDAEAKNGGGREGRSEKDLWTEGIAHGRERK